MTIDEAMFWGSVLVHLVVVLPACWLAFTNWRHRIVAIWIAAFTGPIALTSLVVATAWIVGNCRGAPDPWCLVWFVVVLGPLLTISAVGFVCGLVHMRLLRRMPSTTRATALR